MVNPMKKFDIEAFDPNMAPGATRDGNLIWLPPDTPPMRLDGFAFRRPGGPFRRLDFDPGLPEAINALAGHTAGGMLSFRSDTLTIRIRATLEKPARMDHMPMTGAAGFDLYMGAPGNRRFVGVTRFEINAESYEAEIFCHERREVREFQLNFPLYSGICALEIGVDADAKLFPPSPWNDDRPIVYYGSSIAQGGCASRPGSAHTVQLSRRFNLPVLNFGFSGSGKGEPAVIEKLASIENPRLFILDYEPNAGLDGIRATLSAALDLLRHRHPRVPVVVLSAQRWIRELVILGRADQRCADPLEAIRFQQDQVERRRRAGDRGVHFLDGSGLLGVDWYECTVDGCHPTDLGFRRIADFLEPELRRILNETQTEIHGISENE